MSTENFYDLRTAFAAWQNLTMMPTARNTHRANDLQSSGTAPRFQTEFTTDLFHSAR